MNKVLFDATMDGLQKLWDKDLAVFMKMHSRDRGIRSTQIAALVGALIELGLITDKNVGRIGEKD